MFGIITLALGTMGLSFDHVLYVRANAMKYSLMIPTVESSNCVTDRSHVFEINSVSPIYCATECSNSPNCVAFLFDTNDRSCIGKSRMLRKSELCMSTPGFKYYQSRLRDCQAIKMTDPEAETGIYSVSLLEGGEVKQLDVYCDMDTAGVGWTVFQKRFDGSVSFSGNFNEFESGFGDLEGEFWLGLKWLYLMTSTRELTLRIDMQEEADGAYRYAQYSNFFIGQPEEYTLNFGTFSGNTTDSLAYHRGMAFSAPDRDQDRALVHCSAEYKNGFWFNKCQRVNTNGQYIPSSVDHGFYWKRDDVFRRLKASEIKFS